ncbi:MAG: 50S ribosomal protein L18 [Candidatus Aenigmarchaeota archaeon]|nr:50S ribosomal protein L18 [Candidatus Aenigmarchaeota archaeon]
MFKIFHRRRRQKKTDASTRLNLLRSGKIRVVLRRTLTGMSIQFVDYKVDGDVTKVSAVAADLKKFGWKAHTGNIPSAYLIGLVAGLRAKSVGIEEAILDVGLQTSTKASRLYAALKGLIDAGINIPHSEEILPDDARVSGDHIAKYAQSMDGDKKNKLFSKYIAAGINPDEVPKHFAEVKQKIIDAKGVNK